MFDVNDIKAFVKRSVGHDAEYKEAGVDIPYYVYAADSKVYELNSTTGFLLLTGQLDNMSYVKPFDTVDGDVTWNIEDDVISGYYKDGNMKIPVIDKHIAAYINKDNELTILDYTFMSTLLEQLTSVYVTLDVWAQSHDKSVPAAKRQCQLGRVCGAVQIGGSWFVPEYAPYPKREVADKKIYQVPECALSNKAIDFMNLMLHQGYSELAFGIKLESYVNNGIMFRIILPEDFDDDTLNWLYSCNPDEDDDDGAFQPLIPYSILYLLEKAVAGKYTEICIMNHFQHPLLATSWKKYDTHVAEEDDADFGDNMFDVSDAVEYQNVVVYAGCNRAKISDTLLNKIQRMNYLFARTEDPVVRGCLTNVKNFEEFHDKLKL